MANHGYIPRDGRNLTFYTIFYGLKECYGLSTPLVMILTLGGFLLIGRSPICLPFAARSPDRSRSQPGVIDLKLVGLHGGVEHNASLVHGDCPMGAIYPSTRIQHNWVEKLIGDVRPPVRGYGEATKSQVVCTCSCDTREGESLLSSTILSRLDSRVTVSALSQKQTSGSIIPRPEGSTTVGADEDVLDWRRFATKAYLDTLVSEVDVARMRARRERECEGKTMTWVNREIARGEMAIILGVWEKDVDLKDEKVKKGIPLPWLLTWLGEERLPEGWKPDHVQGLWDVIRRIKAIRRTTEAICLVDM
ncbi:hypothetical protein PM082_006274 [Marasmius tenuissimus]|nr:hypothetical protein PM082_006274 [Marasmius tenuissimus]